MFFVSKPRTLFFIGGVVVLGFFIFGTTRAISSTTSDDSVKEQITQNNFISFNEYSIKQRPEENLPKDVLLIYSISQADENTTDRKEELVNLHNLAQIIESHWNARIELKEFTDVHLQSLEAYPYYILAELDGNTDAASLFEKITNIEDAKTMWIGCNIDLLFKVKKTGKNIEQLNAPTPNANVVKRVTYKDIQFDNDYTSAICSQTQDIQADKNTEILSTYTAQEGTEKPLSFIYDTDHIFVAHTVPYYYDTNNYSLPFLDTFHYFLGHHDAPGVKPALIRFEDINIFTYSYPRKLNRAFKYLSENSIPYHIALIEHYKNPTEGISLHANDSIRFLNSLKYAVKHDDAVLVQHGYTHQVGNEISGAGFEFWDAQTNSPLQFDTDEEAYTYALEKIKAAQIAMVNVGLPVPDIWETPHYALSAIDNDAINLRYPIRYEHVPNIGILPFAAKINDTLYIPENLGYIFDSGDEIGEKKLLLEKLEVFEDPVASIFWHPWRDIEELRDLTTMIEDHGYTFVSAYDLFELNKSVFRDEIVISGTLLTAITDIMLYVVFISFLVGVLLYTRNVLRVRKHFKEIDAQVITLKDILIVAGRHNRPIPQLALFIPARNEGLVISNTLKRISNLDYPKNKLDVYVITDERELEDQVSAFTKDVAKKIANELHRRLKHEFIHIVEVPKWYSGIYGNLSHTYEKSTKGRALNYCLQTINTDAISMIGVLDADGRLHKDVLKEVAYKWITKQSKVLQGPVFQISNFANVNLVGKIAGLELALHHLTELPTKLKRNGAFQFFAGTNYFIETTSIKQAGGWNQSALVEDAELALRLYSQNRIVGEWLNAPELEQTPANFSIYRKQRERWVRGHFQLLKQISQSNIKLSEKVSIYIKIFSSQFRFLFDIGLPLISIYFMIAGAYAYIDPIFGYLSIFLFIASAFIWDTYGYIFRKLSHYFGENITLYQYMYYSVLFILFLPIFIVLQAIPRIEALINHVFKKKNQAWYKTERTAESAIS